MTNDIYSDTPDHRVTAQESPSTTETAMSEAQNVASSAVESGGQILKPAKSETSEVVAQAGQSARELFEQVRQELTDQAGSQQHRVAAGLREVAQELEQMGAGSEQSGLAGSLVQQVSDRTRSSAEWLEQRDPGDLVTEVKRYAARKPGTFLAAAAALGFLGARLTRGLAAASSSPSGASGFPSGRPTTALTNDSGVDVPSGIRPPLAPVTPGTPETAGTAGYRYEEDVPTVTTFSHGEPVTYPTATGGTPPSTSPPPSGDGYLEGRA